MRSNYNDTIHYSFAIRIVNLFNSDTNTNFKFKCEIISIDGVEQNIVMERTMVK